MSAKSPTTDTVFLSIFTPNLTANPVVKRFSNKNLLVLLSKKIGPAIAIAEILNHTGGNMKYRYTTLDITTRNCGTQTKGFGMKLWLEEWRRSQHIQQCSEGDTIMKHATRHRSIMRTRYPVLTLLLSVCLCLISSKLMAQEANVTPLMSKVMTDAAGKEGLLIKVEYPPGSSDVIHRHNAHAFVYVLEGSIVMQLKGGKQVTLTPGQTFYEGPNDVHIVGRNASNTQAAKFVVFLVKENGALVLVPAK
jgi:quercetin dioxygenase-like cupin family protein